MQVKSTVKLNMPRIKELTQAAVTGDDGRGTAYRSCTGAGAPV